MKFISAAPKDNGAEYWNLPHGRIEEVFGRDAPFDPELHRLLFADELENGMVVLAEPMERVVENAEFTDIELAKMCNRWCEVSRLRTKKDPLGEVTEIFFVGLYKDGTETIRQSDYYKGWWVLRPHAANASLRPVRPH